MRRYLTEEHAKETGKGWQLEEMNLRRLMVCEELEAPAPAATRVAQAER